jgi:hypothetical protein
MIDSHFLINRTVLREDDSYTGMIKAEVNTESLPAVIRSEAAASKKLQLDSPWLEWPIKE